MMIETTLKACGWVLNSHNEWVSPDGYLFVDKIDAYTYHGILNRNSHQEAELARLRDELATAQAALDAQSQELAAAKKLIREMSEEPDLHEVAGYYQNKLQSLVASWGVTDETAQESE